MLNSYHTSGNSYNICSTVIFNGGKLFCTIAQTRCERNSKIFMHYKISKRYNLRPAARMNIGGVNSDDNAFVASGIICRWWTIQIWINSWLSNACVPRLAYRSIAAIASNISCSRWASRLIAVQLSAKRDRECVLSTYPRSAISTLRLSSCSRSSNSPPGNQGVIFSGIVIH